MPRHKGTKRKKGESPRCEVDVDESINREECLLVFTHNSDLNPESLSSAVANAVQDGLYSNSYSVKKIHYNGVLEFVPFHKNLDIDEVFGALTKMGFVSECADHDGNKNYVTIDLKLEAECEGEAKLTKIAVPAKTPFGFIRCLVPKDTEVKDYNTDDSPHDDSYVAFRYIEEDDSVFVIDGNIGGHVFKGSWDAFIWLLTDGVGRRFACKYLGQPYESVVYFDKLIQPKQGFFTDKALKTLECCNSIGDIFNHAGVPTQGKFSGTREEYILAGSLCSVRLINAENEETIIDIDNLKMQREGTVADYWREDKKFVNALKTVGVEYENKFAEYLFDEYTESHANILAQKFIVQRSHDEV